MTVLTRSQCPQCLDSGRDNLIEYSDGGKHCFACGYHEGTEITEEMGNMLSGEYKELNDRCISKSICEFFDYEIGQDDVHIKTHY